MSHGAGVQPNDNSNHFDVFEVFDVITQQTRKDLITDIVGHPKGMPSMKELQYMSPDIDRTTILGHLRTLEDANVVGSVAFPEGQRPDEGPYKFYYITEQARELFDKNGIFDPAVRQPLYAQVEKPEDVQYAEELARPQIQ
ncbi:ArsR family transcriptional regulator [Haladaptatus sp. DFWS20]|uniref:ArsR family transcriptional regulator n=1 Tax=Haladaptatus sp. DFWS20 TaxID=3403467 RepID=UPI003EBDD289